MLSTSHTFHVTVRCGTVHFLRLGFVVAVCEALVLLSPTLTLKSLLFLAIAQRPLFRCWR